MCQFNGILIFEDNIAELAGNSIFVSPLYDCKQLHLKEINLSDLYEKIFYFNGNKQAGEISSVPVSTQHCNNDDKHIKVYPGQTITIGLHHTI